MTPPKFDHKDSDCYRFPRQCPGLSHDLEPNSQLPARIFDATLIAALLLGIGFAAGWHFCKINGG
jgi:hypothetical protein